MFYKTFKIVLKYLWLGLGFELGLGLRLWLGLGLVLGVMVRVSATTWLCNRSPIVSVKNLALYY